MHLFEDIWFVTSSGLIDWETQAAKTVLNYSIFKIAVDDKWLLKIDHLSLGTLAAVGGRTERGWTRIWTLPGAKTVIWEGKGALRHPSPSFVFLMCFEKLCMCVCGIRTQFVICESKFGAGSNPPSYPVEPTPSEPHGAASLWEGQIGHRNVEVVPDKLTPNCHIVAIIVTKMYIFLFQL